MELMTSIPEKPARLRRDNDSSAPNILIIGMDRCRPDRMGCSGHWRPTTPNLDRIPEKGILFTQSFAEATPTGASLERLLPRLVGGVSPWLAAFSKANYKTCAVAPQGLADSIPTGWDLLLTAASHPLSGKTASRDLVDQARSWIHHTQRDKKLLLLLLNETLPPYQTAPRHYFDRYFQDDLAQNDPRMEAFWADESWRIFCGSHPHPDMAISPPEVRTLEWHLAWYDACLKAMDDAMEPLLEAVAGPDWLVVLVSLVGEQFGEGGIYFSPGSLHDAALRTAWAMRWPGHILEGLVSDELVCASDLIPTLASAAGIETSLGGMGINLMPLALGQDRRTRNRIPMCHSQDGVIVQRGLRTKRHKFVRSWDRGPLSDSSNSLFNVISDPLEERDIAQDCPHLVQAFASQLDCELPRSFL